MRKHDATMSGNKAEILLALLKGNKLLVDLWGSYTLV